MIGRIAGGLLVLLVFGCGSTKQASQAEPGIEIAVTEKGFEPGEVTVPAGEPVTLVITRQTEQTCAKEVVIADYGIRETLPMGEPVKVSFTPRQGGEVKFACGMDMITGRIIVK